MRKMNILSCMLVFVFSAQLFGQYPNIRVSNFAGLSNPSEESIMINYKNPNQIVIGVNATLGAVVRMGYYYSSNGGFNWSGNYLYSNLALPYCDPVIIADTSGYFYFIGLANPISPGTNTDRIICSKSTNGGMNWADACVLALVAPKQNDKEYACVDFSNNSPYKNTIYVAWSLFDTYQSHNPNDSSYMMFCRSTNNGISFSAPLRIGKIAGSAVDSNLAVTGALPCTGPNGEIYISWARWDSIFINRSTDGGNTWLNNEICASKQVAGWTHTNGLPVSACDISNSAYRGTVYICFADKRNGFTDTDIWIVKSTDKGNTWSSAVRINNDGLNNIQYCPWMCVDPVTGYIWAVFYDNRYHFPLYDVTVARSTNGGNSFVNLKTSTTSSLLNAYIGDYIGITAYNNKVRTAWAYNYSGSSSEVWTALIDTVFNISIEHVPLQSTFDTSARTVLLNDYSIVSLGSGSNSPRLYYKTGNGAFNFLNPNTHSQYLYSFRIPGQSQGTKVYYYFAVQDSAGTIVSTLPAGGSGINPPGTIPPASLYSYEIYSNLYQCSNTLPKQILDNQTTFDTINVNQNGYVAQVKVNLTINHTNDGDLIIRLVKPGIASCDLSIRNGQGGQNFTNTTFDDGASISITQGPPPFTGGYRPQSPLSVFINNPISGNWILKTLDTASGNQGSLTNWCTIFLVKSSVNVQESEIPVKYELSQNYPNPFNSSTRINYSIPKNSNVELKIYDMLGREVRTLVNEYQNAGNYVVMFNAGELASGMYFYRMICGDYSDTKKLILVK